MDTVERSASVLKPLPGGAKPQAAFTQRPPETEPDPYVWVPADNPLIGQTPRQAPQPQAETRVEAPDARTDWRWRDGLIGLTIGILAGGAAATVLFAVFFNPRN